MDWAAQIRSLREMTVWQLRNSYKDLFGEESHSCHKEFLVKRIVWRMQVLAEGDISEATRQKARQIASDADIRLKPPMNRQPPIAYTPDQARTIFLDFTTDIETRIPMSGYELTRTYRGRHIVVRVLDNGFRYEGKCYKTLSAVAEKITGYVMNGFDFFGLGSKISARKRVENEPHRK